MGKIIRKADIVLFAVLAAVGVLAAVFPMRGESGRRVLVRRNGETVGVYDLTEDREVTLNADGHFNQFIIRDGQVQMTEADCANHDCIRTGPISRTNQSIVCLPNKVSLTIEGEEESPYVDVVAE